MAKFYTIVVLYFLLGSLPLFGQTYNVQIFDHRTDLSTNYVSAIDEDENGYLWLGTEALGIARFDGENFKYFNNLLFGSGLSVKDINIDEEKQLYVSLGKDGFFHSKIDSIMGIELKRNEVRHPVYSVFKREDKTIVIDDRSIKIYADGKIINELAIEHKNQFEKYGEFHESTFSIIFTNAGNFVFDAYEIIPLDQWLGTEKELANSCVHAFKDNNKLIFLTNNGKQTINSFITNDAIKFFFIDTLENAPQFSQDEKLVSLQGVNSIPTF